jgi:hypothetical protein
MKFDARADSVDAALPDRAAVRDCVPDPKLEGVSDAEPDTVIEALWEEVVVAVVDVVRKAERDHEAECVRVAEEVALGRDVLVSRGLVPKVADAGAVVVAVTEGERVEKVDLDGIEKAERDCLVVAEPVGVEDGVADCDSELVIVGDDDSIIEKVAVLEESTDCDGHADAYADLVPVFVDVLVALGSNVYVASTTDGVIDVVEDIEADAVTLFSFVDDIVIEPMAEGVLLEDAVVESVGPIDGAAELVAVEMEDAVTEIVTFGEELAVPLPLSVKTNDGNVDRVTRAVAVCTRVERLDLLTLAEDDVERLMAGDRVEEGLAEALADNDMLEVCALDIFGEDDMSDEEEELDDARPEKEGVCV